MDLVGACKIKDNDFLYAYSVIQLDGLTRPSGKQCILALISSNIRSCTYVCIRLGSYLATIAIYDNSVQCRVANMGHYHVASCNFCANPTKYCYICYACTAKAYKGIVARASRKCTLHLHPACMHADVTPRYFWYM